MAAGEHPAQARGEQAAYWLRRCHGFRVESEGRRIGTVEEVLYGAEHDRPAAVLIRTGLFKHRLETIPISRVGTIYPRAQVLALGGLRHD